MDRTKGIGGTDIGAIIGVNPWKGPMDVYLEKVGITESPEDNEAMWWGREMEPMLAKRYMKETGFKVWLPDRTHIYRDDLPWYVGLPDGLISKIGQRFWGGVDFKTTGYRSSWGDPGTDEVPEWIHAQADWYMGLIGAEWWDIAVLFFSPRREFCIYRIPRNQELIDNLIAAGKEFWEEHVLKQVPPPLDASPASKTLLNYLYPADQGEMLEANDLIETLVFAIKEYEQMRDESVRYLTHYQNQLKNIIGDAAGVQTSLGKITWKKTKDREVVDWKQVSDILVMFLAGAFSPDRAFLMQKEAIKQATQTRPGSRVFRAWWKKED